MNRQTVRGLLQARLATLGWASQTAWENVPFTPTTGTAYQEVATAFSEPDAFTLADSSQSQGVFQVRLLYPLNVGTGEADARAKAIADIFPRNLTLPIGGPPQIKITREPHVTGGGKQGDRDVTVIRIRFSDR